MKKYFIIAIAMMCAFYNLQAETREEILSLLNSKAQAYKNNISKDTREWKNSFERAKKFVESNSKNLIGIKDSEIMKNLKEIEAINLKVLDILKNIAHAKDTAELTYIHQFIPQIQKNITDVIHKIYTKKLDSQKKTEAQNIIIGMANALKDILDGAVIVLKQAPVKSPSTPIPSASPKPNIPVAPPVIPAPARPAPQQRGASFALTDAMKNFLTEEVSQVHGTIKRTINLAKGNTMNAKEGLRAIVGHFKTRFESELKRFNAQDVQIAICAALDQIIPATWNRVGLGVENSDITTLHQILSDLKKEITPAKPIPAAKPNPIITSVITDDMRNFLQDSLNKKNLTSIVLAIDSTNESLSITFRDILNQFYNTFKPTLKNFSVVDVARAFADNFEPLVMNAIDRRDSDSAKFIRANINKACELVFGAGIKEFLR